ncbi:hypothetical protein [Candidatus Venteria ishoeyi]|uniref:hypothetical protein n=1 Tax=Candidatus Venteria ishoeyi TaxID=1899563 RepID=UPI000CDEF372|nr:hypothetical protein [Candidatus Venteria ishoeyi]
MCSFCRLSWRISQQTKFYCLFLSGDPAAPLQTFIPGQPFLIYASAPAGSELSIDFYHGPLTGLTGIFQIYVAYGESTDPLNTLHLNLDDKEALMPFILEIK